jgi:hypothetical protein
MDRGFRDEIWHHGNVPGQLPEMGLGLAGGWNKLSQTDRHNDGPVMSRPPAKSFHLVDKVGRDDLQTTWVEPRLQN